MTTTPREPVDKSTLDDEDVTRVDLPTTRDDDGSLAAGADTSLDDGGDIPVVGDMRDRLDSDVTGSDLGSP